MKIAANLSQYVVLLALLLAIEIGATTAADPPARPNILFIMSDDHAFQAISAYNGRLNKTPNIDRIANEGMRFDRAFVTNSLCGPCRATILTGKYSHKNGFYDNYNSRFFGGQPHVAKYLQGAGYQTAVVGKWHLISQPTGFDHYHILQGQGPYYNPVMNTPDGVVKHVGYTTEIITDVAIDWLEKGRDKAKSFFLMCHHKAPHRNWQPSPKYLTKYNDVEIPEPETLRDDYRGRTSAAANQQMTVAKHLTPNDLKLVPQGGLNEEQRIAWDAAYGPENEKFKQQGLEGDALLKWKYQRYMKDYLRCVDSVDESVGRMLAYLEKEKLLENTLVIYASDQGFYLGEHGWYDKRWMYEESFRTPLVMRWPGHIKPASVNRDLVVNIDLAETFLDVAGVAIPPDMQGRSLKPVLEGKTPADWRKSVYYHYYEFPQDHRVQSHYGVRTDRYKLIYFDRTKEWELFDLEKDPHELKSVAEDPAYAETRKELTAELGRLREQYQDDDSIVKFPEPEGPKPPMKKKGK